MSVPKISDALRQHFRQADRLMIIILWGMVVVALALSSLHDTLGWALFGFVWALAIVGICKELWWGRETVPSVPLYVLMGWCGVAAAVPLMKGLQDEGWMWLLAGGVLYTVGIVFYVLDKRLRHAHGIRDLFVLGGTTSHYFTVLKFVG